MPQMVSQAQFCSEQSAQVASGCICRLTSLNEAYIYIRTYTEREREREREREGERERGTDGGRGKRERDLTVESKAKGFNPKAFRSVDL